MEQQQIPWRTKPKNWVKQLNFSVMEKMKTSAFFTVPTLLFLLTAMALLVFRKPPPARQIVPKARAIADTLPIQAPRTDTVAVLPDSLNPFIKMVDLDEVTERVLAVKQCGNCHQREYQNWSDGPHAYAYRGVRKLYEEASDSTKGLFPPAYGKWIHQNLSICFQCHVTENLYETNFKGIESVADLAQINDSTFPELHEMGHPRTDPLTFTTGIDCYTCHYNGERIITGPDFKQDPKKKQMPGYCNPLPTAFFTTNSNCVTCHKFAHETLEANLSKGMKFEETNCIKCHMEFDAHGNGTHFEDWRFADRKRHPSKHAKGGLFESLKFKVEKGTQSRLTVDWHNAISPHGLTECGEVVLEIVVKDQNGKNVLKEDIRLNRKAQHDEHLRKQLFGAEPPGIVGFPFDPSDPPIREIFELKGNNIRSGRIYLTALDKAQYWGDDKIGVKIYRKEIAF